MITRLDPSFLTPAFTIGLNDGENTYLYVLNNPLQMIDTLGLFSFFSSRDCQEFAYTRYITTSQQADKLNAAVGNAANILSVLGGSLATALPFGVSVSGTVGSAIGLAISTYFTNFGTTFHAGDEIKVSYDICTTDTDFGVQAENHQVNVIHNHI